MKSDKYQKRFYRQWVFPKGMQQAHVAVQETDLQVITDKPVDKQFLLERVRLYRRQIEGYVNRDRRFLTTLKPIAVELTAPAIVKEMAEAAGKAEVGRGIVSPKDCRAGIGIYPIRAGITAAFASVRRCLAASHYPARRY